jgi:acylphosphatase
MTTKLYRIHVTGRVQGVFYRLAAKDEALKLRLAGFAKNDADGGVTIEVEGERPKLELFLAWCRVGPEVAAVKNVEFIELPPAGHVGFRVF